MLQRDVQILAHLRVVGHLLKHVLREIGRIRIVDPDPLYAVDLRESAYQFGKGPPAIEVKPVVCRVLCYENQLLDSPFGKHAGLPHKLLHRHGAVRPADERYGAIRAPPVAALRDFQIGIALAGSKPARRRTARLHPEMAQHRGDLPRSEPRVNFRNLLLELSPVTLREAAEDNHLGGLSPALGGYSLKHRIDGLFFGVADKAAGVDEQTVDRAVPDNLEFLGRQLREQMLSIYRVLGTAEGDSPKPLPLRPAAHLPSRNQEKRTSRSGHTSQAPCACAKDRSGLRHSSARPS